MQAALHRTDRNAEAVRDLRVAELLEVREEEDLAEVPGHLVDDLLHHRGVVGDLEGCGGRAVRSGQEVDERAVSVVSDGCVEARGGAAALAAQEVAALVRGDRVEPGLEAPLLVERVGREVDLKERLLEDIVGGRLRAEEAREESVQFAVVALHEDAQGRRVAGPVRDHERLVGPALDGTGGRGAGRARRGVFMGAGVVHGGSVRRDRGRVGEDSRDRPAARPPCGVRGAARGARDRRPDLAGDLVRDRADGRLRDTLRDAVHHTPRDPRGSFPEIRDGARGAPDRIGLGRMNGDGACHGGAPTASGRRAVRRAGRFFLESTTRRATAQAAGA